ncbi:MAG: hypothetical protein V4513_07970 [Pseudomonadota bacterium]
MNETAASSDARRGETAAQLIARLSLQCRDNPIIEGLAEINEAIEADCLASALRASKHPELEGLGISFDFGGSSGAKLMDRAMGPPGNLSAPVQRVALHGATAPLYNGSVDRAEVAKNRSSPTADDVVASVDGGFGSNETVQPLSVKDSENNGCTAGSTSPFDASRPASTDNFFASPSPARSARKDNDPCTASAPPSPVQEISVYAPHSVTDLVEDQSASEEPLAEFALGYCRCDFFDNGPTTSTTGTKSGRGRARFKINVFIGPDRRSWTPFKLAFLSEGRFFKRSAPAGHSAFYEKVWDRFEELRKCVRDERLSMEINPILAHVKTRKNHVVPRAAAILLKAEGEPADVILFLDGSVFPIELDKKAKGSAKCPALKALGYWNPEK